MVVVDVVYIETSKGVVLVEVVLVRTISVTTSINGRVEELVIASAITFASAALLYSPAFVNTFAFSMATALSSSMRAIELLRSGASAPQSPLKVAPSQVALLRPACVHTLQEGGVPPLLRGPLLVPSRHSELLEHQPQLGSAVQSPQVLRLLHATEMQREKS